MARGELMKKLLASYGRDDEFRAVARMASTKLSARMPTPCARFRKTLPD
jgi:hypothetical protein